MATAEGTDPHHGINSTLTDSIDTEQTSSLAPATALPNSQRPPNQNQQHEYSTQEPKSTDLPLEPATAATTATPLASSAPPIQLPALPDTPSSHIRPINELPPSRSRWATRKMTTKRSASKRLSLMGRLHDRQASKEKNGSGKLASNLSGQQPGENMSDDASNASEDDKDVAQSRMLFFNLNLPDEFKNSNGQPTQSFPRNKIRTAKYTAVSFIPKNLWFQFHNVANIFFLFLVILVFFPIFGGVNPGLNAVPLIVIITITAIKDAYEDVQRTELDVELNNAPVHRLCGWHNVNVEEDNVSTWRKFKKGTSRITGSVWLFLKSLWSPKAKAKRVAHKEEKLRAAEADLPRASIESRRARPSMPSRTSTHIVRKSLAHDDIPMTPVASPGLRGTDSNGSSTGGSPDNGDVATAEAAKRMAAIRSMKKNVINHHAQVRGSHFKKSSWKTLQAGDFVRLYNNDELPADVLILSTSDRDGACYVETKNLDGETNLKVRSALRCSRDIKHARDCERAQFAIESEQPHPNLYKYNAAIRWQQQLPNEPDGEAVELTEPIGIDNLLLRGTNLRNTDWVLGVVLFTGWDTKIMLNSGQTPSKRSRIARELNTQIAINFIVLVIMCLVSGLVNGAAMARKDQSHHFFDGGNIGGTAALSGFITFWAAFILFQNLVPISLYVTLEVVRTLQALFIYSDILMYDETTEQACIPKSWNISDDLGQIEYIFSDKTGTLTQNVMEFKKATVNGQPYGEAYTEAQAGMRKRMGIDVDAEAARVHQEIADAKVRMLAGLRAIHDNPFLHDEQLTFVAPDCVSDLAGDSGPEQQTAVTEFMLALALCHTVVAELVPGSPPSMEFKAQSPDEAALVATARDMGFTVLSCVNDVVALNVMGEERQYQILNTIEFNSTRKRMSAIVRTPDNRIVLYCKGADSIIYSRLQRGEQREMRAETAEHLEMFAREGLRTLCVARRELSEKEYYDWKHDHDTAAASIDGREDKLEAVADRIERQLTLLGGTAIEDRLQDGVPDTIELLANAGIKLWVLTGDKVETAINIGFSCNLLSNEMELISLRVTEEEDEPVGGTLAAANMEKQCIAELEEQLDRSLASFGMTGSDAELKAACKNHHPPAPTHALVIDGSALKWALHDALKQKFLLLCKQCKSVLCCRVSPAQKAAVVSMVKSGLDVVTLSIGDGANDVAMIQQADVGVGIAGHEGRQAAMSSDYAIGQFRFLARLLLVHGRWSYRRLAEAIPNFFYKNMVWTFAIFWYQAFCDFDMTYVFDYIYLLCFAVVFTSLPVGVMGVLDQDVSDRVSLAVPQLYRRGIERLEWSARKFWLYMADGIYQSIMVFFIPYLIHSGNVSVTTSGRGAGDIPRFGAYVAHPAVITVNLYILMNTYRWDWLMVLVVVFSDLALFIVTGIYTSLSTSQQFLHGAKQIYSQPSFWMSFFVTIVFCLLPRFTIKAVQKVYLPYDVDIVREMELRGDFDQFDEHGKDRSRFGADGKRIGGGDCGPADARLSTSSTMIKPTPPHLEFSSQNDAEMGSQGKQGNRSSVDDENRPIYPPSFLTNTTANRNIRSQTGHGSDSTTFTTGPRDASIDFGGGEPQLPPATEVSTAEDSGYDNDAVGALVPSTSPMAAHKRPSYAGDRTSALSFDGANPGRNESAAAGRSRPSIDRTRPSYDRMRWSMDPVRTSFEASSDFTSAARLSKIESSRCPGESTGSTLRSRLRGLSLSRSAAP